MKAKEDLRSPLVVGEGLPVEAESILPVRRTDRSPIDPRHLFFSMIACRNLASGFTNAPCYILYLYVDESDLSRILGQVCSSVSG